MTRTRMRLLVVSSQSLLPGVSLMAAHYLTSVDRFIRMNLGVVLEMFLSGEGLVTI